MICVAKKKDEGTKNLAWPTPLIDAFEAAIVDDGLNQRQKSVMLIAAFLSYLRAPAAERARARAMAASGLMQAKSWQDIIADAKAESLRAGYLVVDREPPAAEAIARDAGNTPEPRKRSRREKPESSAPGQAQ
jgi:hypothetical protein